MVNEERSVSLLPIPWNIKNRMFAQLQKKNHKDLLNKN